MRQKLLALALTLALVVSLCPVALANEYDDTRNQINAQIDGINQQIDTLKAEYRKNYSTVVFVSGRIVNESPLTVIEESLIGTPHFYIIQNPQSGSRSIRGYYQGWHQIVGSTPIYYEQKNYTASIVNLCPARALEIQNEIDALEKAKSKLYDQRHNSEQDQASTVIGYRDCLATYSGTGATIIFQLGNPMMYVTGARATEAFRKSGASHISFTNVTDKTIFSVGDERNSQYITYIEDFNFHAMPEVINGSTMVPIRPLIEWLGGEVIWDSASGSIACQLGPTKVELIIDSDVATVDGVTYPLPTPVTVRGGKTLVPLRFVSEQLGCSVEWMPVGQCILIYARTEEWVLSKYYTKQVGDYYERWDPELSLRYFYPTNFTTTTELYTSTEYTSQVRRCRTFSYGDAGGFKVIPRTNDWLFHYITQINTQEFYDTYAEKGLYPNFPVISTDPMRLDVSIYRHNKDLYYGYGTSTHRDSSNDFYLPMPAGATQEKDIYVSVKKSLAEDSAGTSSDSTSAVLRIVPFKSASCTQEESNIIDRAILDFIVSLPQTQDQIDLNDDDYSLLMALILTYWQDNDDIFEPMVIDTITRSLTETAENTGSHIALATRDYVIALANTQDNQTVRGLIDQLTVAMEQSSSFDQTILDLLGKLRIALS